MVQKKALPKAKPVRKAAQKRPAPHAVREDKKTTPTRLKSPKAHTASNLVLLPVEPYLLHAFWDIHPPDLNQAKKQIKGQKDHASTFLRFYDVTGITPGKKKAHHTFDVQIDPNANNWYVRLWSAGRSYYAELGLKAGDEPFVSVTRSNVTNMPADQPAQPIEEHLPIRSVKRDTMQDAKQARRTIDPTRINEEEFTHGISSIIPTEK
jgi:hypothetical protein